MRFEAVAMALSQSVHGPWRLLCNPVSEAVTKKPPALALQALDSAHESSSVAVVLAMRI